MDAVELERESIREDDQVLDVIFNIMQPIGNIKVKTMRIKDPTRNYLLHPSDLNHRIL